METIVGSDRSQPYPTSAETSYVIGLLRARFGHGEQPHRSQSVTARGVYDAARMNKVANLLRPPEDDEISETLRTYLDDYRRRTFALNSTTIAATIEVSDMLGIRGIPNVILKGPLHQQTLYGDHFAKPSGDVDVLVSSRDFNAGKRIVLDLGYELDERARSIWWSHFLGEQHFVRNRGTVRSVVDLHHRIGQPGTPSPTRTVTFLDTAINAKVAGADIRVLDQRHACLLAAISIGKALYSREACLGHACDLWLIFNAFSTADRENVWLLARSQRLDGTLRLALRAAALAIGPINSPPSTPIEKASRGLRDADLLRLVSEPWLVGNVWPKRREMLWDLCGRRPTDFGREATWATFAEISRRLFDEPADA